MLVDRLRCFLISHSILRRNTAYLLSPGSVMRYLRFVLLIFFRSVFYGETDSVSCDDKYSTVTLTKGLVWHCIIVTSGTLFINRLHVCCTLTHSYIYVSSVYNSWECINWIIRERKLFFGVHEWEEALLFCHSVKWNHVINGHSELFHVAPLVDRIAGAVLEPGYA